MIAYFQVEETVVRASASHCYALVLAVRRYGEWWHAHCVPLGAEGVLHIGSRFSIHRGPMRCVVEVVRLDPYRRIELRYVEGDLLGPLTWEFDERGDATRVRHVYRGVCANSPRAERALAGDGLRRHGAALHADAFAGMRRVLEAPATDVSGGDLFAIPSCARSSPPPPGHPARATASRGCSWPCATRRARRSCAATTSPPGARPRRSPPRSTPTPTSGSVPTTPA
jgi:hypothetical protein